MEDVNPLIENNKLPHIESRLVHWRSQTSVLLIKFRYHLVVCLTGLLVTVFLLVLLSFLFTGGKTQFVYFQITPAQSHTHYTHANSSHQSKFPQTVRVFPCWILLYIFNEFHNPIVKLTPPSCPLAPPCELFSQQILSLHVRFLCCWVTSRGDEELSNLIILLGSEQFGEFKKNSYEYFPQY